MSIIGGQSGPRGGVLPTSEFDRPKLTRTETIGNFAGSAVMAIKKQNS
jgi:hypothetical protein